MTEQKPPVQESPGVGLRLLALTTPVSKLGFSPDSDFPQVYGVLTDWNLGDQTASIMSMRDGTASLYTTSSFGIIGGQGHESMRQAPVHYVKLAEQYFDLSKAVTEFAYPKHGQVHYYLLTYDGVRLCVGDESAIERGSDPTMPLFEAAQEVVTELRRMTEKQDARPGAEGDTIDRGPSLSRRADEPGQPRRGAEALPVDAWSGRRVQS